MKPLFASNGLLPGSRYTSARAAAMGEAYLPLGDDPATGLFYNPANLGKVRKTMIEPLNLALNVNSAFTNNAGLSFYNVMSLSSYLPNLQRAPGALQTTGLNLFSGFAVPGLAIGILWSNQSGATYNSGDTVTNRSRYQLIPTIGTGVRLFNGLLRLGYSLQWVNLASGGTTVSTSSELSYNQGLSQGSALSHTLGAAITFPVLLLPSINLVARNVLGASYTEFTLLPFTSSSSGVPATEPMSIDLSLSIQPTLGGGASMSLVFENRDVTNQSGVAIPGHLTFGAELDYRNRFFVRGGWGEGYLSGGLGLRRSGGEISLTYFNAEIGQTYQSTPDPRFMLQYQLRNF